MDGKLRCIAFSCLSRFFMEINPHIYKIQDCMVSRTSVDTAEKKKVLFLPGIEFRFPPHLFRVLSLTLNK